MSNLNKSNSFDGYLAYWKRECDRMNAEAETMVERFDEQAICAEEFAGINGENAMLRIEFERLKKGQAPKCGDC